MRAVLTPSQLNRLKDHQYRTEGASLVEYYFLRHFWDWLVEKVPLWVAPNLITFVGFCVTVVTALVMVLQDLNAEGKVCPIGSIGSLGWLLCWKRPKNQASRWTCLFAAIGIFTYQTLDGIDGKQARRTGTSSPLGEYFDHGCDAITVFLYAVVASCAPGMSEFPYLMLVLVVIVVQLNYSYHWQTYVCGVLHFKQIDIGEALLAHIISLLITFFFGPEVWKLEFPGVGLSLKFLTCLGTLFFSILNLLSAYYIILTRGIGKNGSTVADTSVVSPIITPIVLVSIMLLYATHSPARLLHTNCVVFFTAFYFPMSKMVVYMMLAGMTKSPFPLLDPIMLGPLLAYLNLYFGTPLPELYVVTAVALYNIVDISLMCISACGQICGTLGVSCFTIPHPNPDKTEQ